MPDRVLGPNRTMHIIVLVQESHFPPMPVTTNLTLHAHYSQHSLLVSHECRICGFVMNAFSAIGHKMAAYSSEWFCSMRCTHCQLFRQKLHLHCRSDKEFIDFQFDVRNPWHYYTFIDSLSISMILILDHWLHHYYHIFNYISFQNSECRKCFIRIPLFPGNVCV